MVKFVDFTVSGKVTQALRNQVPAGYTKKNLVSMSLLVTPLLFVLNLSGIASAQTQAPIKATALSTNKAYSAGNTQLVLDGTPSGWLAGVDGGYATAEVITEKLGPDGSVKKHIGKPKYEAFSAQVGAGMSKVLYDWIAASWTNKPTRKSGSVILANYDYDAVSERAFTNAQIIETTIPAMDAGSKEPAYLTLKFAPESIRSKKASGKVTEASTPKAAAKWLPGNFRLEIDGLDCSRVNKIDAFTIKQKITDNAVGEFRDNMKEPTNVEFPNLKITMSESAADSWTKWHEDFVINDNIICLSHN